MKFTRRHDLDPQTRINIVKDGWIHQGIYGKMTQMAQDYQISRTFLYQLSWAARQQGSSRPEKLPALAPRRSGRARLRHPAPQNNRFATISARYARSSPRVADNTSGVPGTGPIEWSSSETVGLAICAISGSLRHEIGQDFDRLW
jgi:hypothetical protein